MGAISASNWVRGRTAPTCEQSFRGGSRAGFGLVGGVGAGLSGLRGSATGPGDTSDMEGIVMLIFHFSLAA